MTKVKRLIPNLLTAGNLIGGVLAIIFTLTGHIVWAPYCILMSAIFDFFDGFAARLLKVQNEMGKQLDSLADMVTFGVAPGLMVFVLMNSVNKRLEFNISEPNLWSYFALIIPVFALFRLAKFNIDTRQTSSFIGLPTPAMTLFFAMFPLLILEASQTDVEWKLMAAQWLVNPIFLAVSALIFSVLMVSEWPLFALKFKSFKWKGNEVRFVFLGLSLILFIGLLFWSVPLIIILYLILSIINNALSKTNEI